MKKKLSFLLLAIFVFPLVAMFGCNQVVSYSVVAYSSSAIHGNVSGSGTFKDGSTVMLTANAISGNSFVCWVFQNTTQLEDDSAYKINNTFNSTQKIEKSVLTFTMTSERQGNYTAVFNDSKTMYIKFNSFRFTSTPDQLAEEDSMGKAKIMDANISLSQGSSTSLRTVYEENGLAIKDNVGLKPEKVSEVLKLSATANQHIRAATQLAYSGKTMSISFRADIGFQISTDWIVGTNFDYKVIYASGSYQIVFKFKVSTDQTYYLVLNYSNLSN